MKLFCRAVQSRIATAIDLAIATQCLDRLNQWVQRTRSVIFASGLTGLDCLDETQRLRKFTHKNECDSQTWILTTHNLLKILRAETRILPWYRAGPISPKRALRQRAFQGGVTRIFTLVTGCVTPPWKVQSLATFSFINPLRYAPIANATTGLIQAQLYEF